MQEFLAAVPTAAGRMETFVTHPQEGGPFAPVILYMDVWGVREQLWDLARRVATVGYCALVPDFYYRQGKVRIDMRDASGRTVSFHHLDKATQQKVLAIQSNLTDAMVMEDTAALLRFLDGERYAKPGGVGAIGYCMGGRHVLGAAARYPERLIASASLHGTSLISDRPDSPHLSVSKLRGELYCGFAEVDQFAPPAMIDELARLLKPCAVTARFEIHKGAEHGYALPDRDIFHKQAANRDWELIFAMFHRQIPAWGG